MKVKHVTLITAAIGVALATFGCKETVLSAVPAKPPSIPVAKVIVRTVTQFAEFIITLTAAKWVELHPRVAGYIQGASATAQDYPLRDEVLAYADRLWVFCQQVQTAAMPAPTDWPVSYMQAADRAKQKDAWSAGVQQQFNDFFSEFSRNSQADAQAIPLGHPSFFPSSKSFSSL